MNSEETRTKLVVLSDRVTELDHTLARGMEQRDREAARRDEEARQRDQIRRNLVRLITFIMAAVVVAVIVLAVQVNQHTKELDRSNDLAEKEEARACERGNKSIEVDRMIINGEFDDYLLTAAAREDPARRQVIEDRRSQRLRALAELRPVRECPKPPG